MPKSLPAKARALPSRPTSQAALRSFSSVKDDHFCPAHFQVFYYMKKSLMTKGAVPCQQSLCSSFLPHGKITDDGKKLHMIFLPPEKRPRPSY